MITESTMLVDDFKDEVLSILKPFNARAGWDKTKQALRRELVALLKTKNYVFFSSGYNRYLISTIGSSYLYDVPLYKRGHLSKFRSKRVRIVCTDSGRLSWRGYMAGVVCESPADKVVVKRRQPKNIYTFPA